MIDNTTLARAIVEALKENDPQTAYLLDPTDLTEIGIDGIYNMEEVAAGVLRSLGKAGFAVVHRRRPASRRDVEEGLSHRELLTRLSDKQFETLQLVMRGMSYKQVALHQKVKLGTVTSRMRVVLRTLFVRNRHEAFKVVQPLHRDEYARRYCD